jgi:hypothetical protein
MTGSSRLPDDPVAEFEWKMKGFEMISSFISVRFQRLESYGIGGKMQDDQWVFGHALCKVCTLDQTLGTWRGKDQRAKAWVPFVLIAMCSTAFIRG